MPPKINFFLEFFSNKVALNLHFFSDFIPLFRANFTPYHETLWSETKGKSILVLSTTLLKNVVMSQCHLTTTTRIIEPIL